MSSSYDLTVVAPCYNETEVIPLFYQELCRVVDGDKELKCEFVFVDDGSTDATLAMLNSMAERDARVKVYSLSRNFGHQVALSAGLDVARGEAVVLMDSDLQHPPAVILEMVKRWREGCDIVSAVRQETVGASWFKKASAKLFYKVINWLSDTPIIPGAADFVLLSRRARAALSSMPERHRFLRGMVAWIGFVRGVVPYVAPERAAGKSKYTLWRMLMLATDAVCAFSSKPVRMITRAGLFVVALALAYLAYEVFRFYVWHDAVRGWPSLIAVIILTWGVNLCVVGVIGEYLARVFEEVKGRPLYFFKQTPDA